MNRSEQSFHDIQAWNWLHLSLYIGLITAYQTRKLEIIRVQNTPALIYWFYCMPLFPTWL